MYGKNFEYDCGKDTFSYRVILTDEALSFLRGKVRIAEYSPSAELIEEIVGRALGEDLHFEGNYRWCDRGTFGEKEYPSFCPEFINYIDIAGVEHYLSLDTPPEYLRQICFFNIFDLQIDGSPIRGTLNIRFLSDCLSERELKVRGWYNEDLREILQEGDLSPELGGLANRILGE
jgi:hypothetical protein